MSETGATGGAFTIGSIGGHPVTTGVVRLNLCSPITSNSERLETAMNTESPTVVIGDQDALNDYRRLFFAHVGAVVLTAAFVVPLLLRIASMPAWLSVTYCVVIATVAITFVAAVVKSMRCNQGMRVSNRIQCMVLTLSLSTLQAIFVLPVLICVYAPTLRL